MNAVFGDQKEVKTKQNKSIPPCKSHDYQGPSRMEGRIKGWRVTSEATTRPLEWGEQKRTRAGHGKITKSRKHVGGKQLDQARESVSDEPCLFD